MTTRINITVDQSGLLDQVANQTRANHEALVIQQEQKETEEVASKKLTEKRRSLNQDIKTGEPLAIITPTRAGFGDFNGNNRIGQDPAANRYGGIRILFGFYEVTGGTTPEGAGTLVLPPDSKIEFKKLNSLSEVDDTFAVIWVGTRVSCFTYIQGAWFGDQLSALAQFARRGGIVVVNSEWSAFDCAKGFGGLDNDINNAFGTSIEQRAGQLDLQASANVFLASGRSPLMPTIAEVSASATFSGGVTLYSTGSFTTSVYQKVGKGALMRWADSNSVGEDPLSRLSVNGQGTLVSMAEGLVGWQQSGV